MPSLSSEGKRVSNANTRKSVTVINILNIFLPNVKPLCCKCLTLYSRDVCEFLLVDPMTSEHSSYPQRPLEGVAGIRDAVSHFLSRVVALALQVMKVVFLFIDG